MRATLLLVVALSLTPACGVPTSLHTPQGVTAYKADEAVKRLGELENAAIQANSAGALSEDATRRIVQFVVDADTTAKAAPLGWQATIAGDWLTVKHALPPNLPAVVQTAVALIDAVLGGGDGR